MKKLILFVLLVLLIACDNGKPSPYYVELDGKTIYYGEIAYNGYWPRSLFPINDYELRIENITAYEIRQLLTANLKDVYIKEKLNEENLKRWYNLKINGKFTKTHIPEPGSEAEINIPVMSELEFVATMIQKNHRIVYYKEKVDGVDVVYFMFK